MIGSNARVPLPLNYDSQLIGSKLDYQNYLKKLIKPMPTVISAFVNNKHVVTIQQLLDAMETDLFHTPGDNPILKECADRENQLKCFLNVCWAEIQNHVETPTLSRSELADWRKAKIDSNLKNLLRYLDELVLALNKEKIEQYVSDQQRWETRRLAFEPSPLVLTLSSYYGTVVTDLFWIGDISVADVVAISKRQLPLSDLGKYVDGQVKKISKLLTTHSQLYADREVPLDKLPEAFICLKNKLYTAFNLVMITSIEGIARSFGEYLLDKQRLHGSNQPARKSHSLDGFFRNNTWVADLPVSKGEYIQITGDFTPADSHIITYPDRLGFLRREFKDRRNTLAHGENVEYEDTVQALINSAALAEVLETIVEYKIIYTD
ncbi:MAG TPA: hypothetical protein VFE32_21850 [Puia sp.]|nr:hypothetical protein [Puia sp.]